MERPICTESITSFSFTITEKARTVPVSLSGYCLSVDRQYCLRISPENSFVKIQNVSFQDNEGLDDHGGEEGKNGCFERRFRLMDNSWFSFLPFRFLMGFLTIRAEVELFDKGSRRIQIPVILVKFLPGFDSLQLLWHTCGLLIVLGIFFGFNVASAWTRLGVFFGALVLAPIVAIFCQFELLKRRARTLKNQLADEDDLI